MSTDYIFETPGHPNIYNNNSRNLKIYFALPEIINENTGLLLLIPGFGAHANSKVYVKMRKEFSDLYNLVVVQCDYFGWEFMQANPKAETLDNFNDMGIMQAIDNISALLIVKEILKDNQYIINENKIIAYGHSHGCYLSYLCNAFAPNLFNLIIDNSAWLFPRYLKDDRVITRYKAIQNITIDVNFEYLAREIDYDREILDLSSLYKKIDTNTKFIIFHGEKDHLVNKEEKRIFSQHLKKSEFKMVTESDLDQTIFKSTSHGLDADFLKLFNMIITEQEFSPNTNNKKIESFSIKTNKCEYDFNYENSIPLLNIKSNSLNEIRN